MNELMRHYPDVAAEKLRKYQGREHYPECKVPALNCMIGDVLQFSPVSPVAICEALREAGRQRHPRFWYEFDAASFDARVAVIALDASTFVPFDPRTLDEYRAIPDATKTYYRVHAQDERLFVFEGIPHVLYRGTLDVRAAVLLEV
jgi:hypothetical protein